MNNCSVVRRYCHVVARAACVTKSGSASPWNSTRIFRIFRQMPFFFFRPCRFRSFSPSSCPRRRCCYCPSMTGKNLRPASVIFKCFARQRDRSQRSRGVKEDTRDGGEQKSGRGKETRGVRGEALHNCRSYFHHVANTALIAGLKAVIGTHVEEQF